MTTVIELVLTPRFAEAVDEIEHFWHARESARRWDSSDEVCERLLDWPRAHAKRNPDSGLPTRDSGIA